MPDRTPFRQFLRACTNRPEPLFEVIRPGNAHPSTRQGADPHAKRQSNGYNPHTPLSRRCNEHPPTFILGRRWWCVTGLRILVLMLNAFIGLFYPVLFQRFAVDMRKEMRAGVAQWEHLEKYWTRPIYVTTAVFISWLSDNFISRRSAVAILSVLAAFCVLCLAFLRSFGYLLFVRIAVGTASTSSEVLTVSIISDLLPWSEVFVGTSVFYLTRYLGFTLNRYLVQPLKIGQVEPWRAAMIMAGTIGLAVGLLVGFVVREPKRQKSMVSALNTNRGEGDGVSGKNVTRWRRAWEQNVRSVQHVMKLKGLWVVVSCGALVAIASSMARTYLLWFVTSAYPDQSHLQDAYHFILTIVGSSSVLSGGVIACLTWRNSRTWLWRAAPLHVVSLMYLLGIPFVISAVFSHHGRASTSGVYVFYGTFATALALSEIGTGILPTLIMLLLQPQFKTVGLALVSFAWSTSYTAVEIVRLSTLAESPTSERYRKTIRVCLLFVIPACHVFASVGLFMAIARLQSDMEDISVLDERLPVKRRLQFAAVTVGVFVFLIVPLTFSCSY